MGIATTFSPGNRITGARINLKPYVHAYQSAAQTLTTGTWGEITMGAELVDTINGHSVAVNTARYTPTTAGHYKCGGMVAFVGNTTGDRGAQFRKNGAQVSEGPYGSAAALNGAALLGGTAFAEATIFCNGTSDYISLWGIQNSGGNLNTLVTANVVNSLMIISWEAP